MGKDTALETTKEAPAGILGYLETIKPKLAQAARAHLTPDRLVRLALGEAARNADMMACTEASWAAALSLCNQVGLEPGSSLGHVYLIPRWNRKRKNAKGDPLPAAQELTVIVGYKGLMRLAHNSGAVKRLSAAPIYRYEIKEGLFHYSHEPPEIKHAWSPDAPAALPDEEIVGGYGLAEMADGQRVQCWLSRAQLDKRQRMAAEYGIARDWYPEWVRKTCLRALLNSGSVPLSADMVEAIAAETAQWEAMDYESPEDAAAVTPRATSRTMFSPPTVSPAPIEAEVVTQELQSEPEPPRRTRTTKPKPEPTPAPAIYQVARQAAAEMGVSAPDFEAAARVEMVPQAPEQWTQDDADRVLNALERARGA